MAKVIDFSNADDVYVGDVDLSKISVGPIPAWNEWASLPDFAEPSPVPAAQDFALAAPVISAGRQRYHTWDGPGKISAGLIQPVTSPHADPVLGYVWQVKPTGTCGEAWRGDYDWTPVDDGPSYADNVPETDGFKNIKWIYHLASGTYSDATIEAGPTDSTDVLFMGLKHREQYTFRCCAFTARGYGAWSVEKAVNLSTSSSGMLIPGTGSPGDDWKVVGRTLNLAVRAITQSYPGFIIATVVQQATSQVITGYRFQWRRIEEYGNASSWVDCTDAYPVDADGNMAPEPSEHYVLAGIPLTVRVEVRAFSETADGPAIVALGSGELNNKFAAPTGGPDVDARPVPDPLWPVYDDKFTCVNYGYRWISLDASQARGQYGRDTWPAEGSTGGAACDMEAPIAFLATGGSMPPGGRLVHLGRDTAGNKSLVTADDFELNWTDHALPAIPTIPGTTINTTKVAHQALCWNPTLDKFLLGVFASGSPYSVGWLATAPADLSSWTIVNSWSIGLAGSLGIFHDLYPVGDKFWESSGGRHSTDGVTWSGVPSRPSDFVRFAGQPRQEHTDGKWIVEAIIDFGGADYLVLYESVDLNSWSQVAGFERIRSYGKSRGCQSDQIIIPGGSTGWESQLGRRPLYDDTACTSTGWESWTSVNAGNMIWNGHRMVGAEWTQGPDFNELYRYGDLPVPPAECGDDWWCHFPTLRRGGGMVSRSVTASTPTGKFVLRGFNLPLP